ncbi:MAG TPA: molybdate ABC transporter substrate-binding protein [Alphaproteobacteria bacterium]|nr:molybdate ABC transporter substrate-binding protein [Alphaproteobacteria bacterium]
MKRATAPERGPFGLFHRWIAAVILAVSASGAGFTPVMAQDRSVLVFAAASLKDALDDINVQFGRETGKPAVISYAASSTLARQIEAGAPADIFISADLDWMDYLEKRKLIQTESRKALLGNRLVLIVPKDSAAGAVEITPGFPLANLLGDGKLAMADTNAVPAGKYGRAALDSLGVWSSVERKIAQAENVRAALALVARGEAPYGIVYQTDAAAEREVKIAGIFPENTHPPIVYPIALVAGSSNPNAAAFLAYVESAKARALFEKQGFTFLLE